MSKREEWTDSYQLVSCGLVKRPVLVFKK